MRGWGRDLWGLLPLLSHVRFQRLFLSAHAIRRNAMHQLKGRCRLVIHLVIIPFSNKFICPVIVLGVKSSKYRPKLLRLDGRITANTDGQMHLSIKMHRHNSAFTCSVIVLGVETSRYRPKLLRLDGRIRVNMAGQMHLSI